MAGPPISIADHYPAWVAHGAWRCGHKARIDLGRFLVWGMHDVPMVALCRRLRCPKCGKEGPAEIATGWIGKDQDRGAVERTAKVHELRPRVPKRESD
jgi:hypothetical protein